MLDVLEHSTQSHQHTQEAFATIIFNPELDKYDKVHSKLLFM